MSHTALARGFGRRERWSPGAGQGAFRRMVAGTLPEEVAFRCKKPFIMVKARHRLKTWIERWF